MSTVAEWARVPPVLGPEARAFKPIGSSVLVKPKPEADKIGSIILPDQAKDRIAAERTTMFGWLIVMGPGMWIRGGGRWPMPDVALLPKPVVIYAGGHTEVELDGEKYLLMRDDQIQGELVDE